MTGDRSPTSRSWSRKAALLCSLLIAPLAATLGCSDTAPLAPKAASFSLGEQGGGVTIQGGVKGVVITNLLNNLSISQTVANAKEAAVVCATVRNLESITSPVQFTCVNNP